MNKALFFTLLLSAAFLSCQKEEFAPEDYFFCCKINGVEFSRTSVPTNADNLLEGTLTLTFDQEGKTIIIIIDDYSGKGTYSGNYISYDDGAKTHYGQDGLVEITKLDKKEYIEGTFSGSGEDLSGTSTVSITEGSFRLKYFEF